MVDYVLGRAQEYINAHRQDSLYIAMGDWMVMGLQSGFRKSEWAQDSASLRREHDVARNVDSTSKAFIQLDLQFFGAQDKHLH